VLINHKKERDELLLKDHLHRSSYRILESEKGVSRKAACKKVNIIASELIHSNDLTLLLKPKNSSGIVLLDGKYVPVKELEEQERRDGLIPRSGKRRGKTKKGLVVLPFMDYYTHDIPIFIIALSENSWDIEEGFKLLKATGYILRGIVCDESMGLIAQVAKQVFPDVVIQFCLTHYSKCIDRCFQAKGAKRSHRALENKLKRLEDSFLISTRHHDRSEAVKLSNEMGALEFEYDLLWRVENLFAQLFWGTKTEIEISKWEDTFNETVEAVPKNYPHLKRIKERYKDYYEKRDFILASILNPEVKLPRTTNLIEGFNSTTLEIRFTSIRGFEKEKYARAYVNALILNYRFHRFTDCKGNFKDLNGKSPLQIADPLSTFDFDFKTSNWIPFCKNLKKICKSQPPK
jgi:hypothetical protein